MNLFTAILRDHLSTKFTNEGAVLGVGSQLIHCAEGCFAPSLGTGQLLQFSSVLLPHVTSQQPLIPKSRRAFATLLRAIQIREQLFYHRPDQRHRLLPQSLSAEIFITLLLELTLIDWVTEIS